VPPRHGAGDQRGRDPDRCERRALGGRRRDGRTRPRRSRRRPRHRCLREAAPRRRPAGAAPRRLRRGAGRDPRARAERRPRADRSDRGGAPDRGRPGDHRLGRGQPRLPLPPADPRAADQGPLARPGDDRQRRARRKPGRGPSAGARRDPRRGRLGPGRAGAARARARGRRRGPARCVSEAGIGTVLAAEPDPPAACRALVEAALANGAPDNVAVVVVRLERAGAG
jgi:hypothetical protein